MPMVFIDTSALVAFFNKSDRHHLEAVAMLRMIKEQKIKLLISDYIFDETVTTILTKVGHNVAVRVGEFIFNHKIIEIVWLTDTIKKQAWDYFKKYSDKIYSFTDCTSFVLMKEREIFYYFSFDEDFRRAGFVDFYEILKGSRFKPF